MSEDLTVLLPAGQAVRVQAVPQPAVRWHVGPFRVQKGQGMPLEVTMTWEQEFDLAMNPTWIPAWCMCRPPWRRSWA